jgi:hypothetical protein
VNFDIFQRTRRPSGLQRRIGVGDAGAIAPDDQRVPQACAWGYRVTPAARAGLWGLGAASPLSQGFTLGYFRSLPPGGVRLRDFAAYSIF